MTVAERLAEFDSWRVVEIPFEKIHQRIEELVGGPVWTHQMGSTGMARLRWKIEHGESNDLADVISDLEALRRG